MTHIIPPSLPASPDDESGAGGPAWTVRLIQAEDRCAFDAFHRAFHRQLPGRFRYVTITLEYVFLGAGRSELRAEAVTLVHTGLSPLQGLARAPALFQDHAGQVWSLAEQSAPTMISVESGQPQRGVFTYEFQADCSEFRLYFPGCDGIEVRLRNSPSRPVI